MINILEPFIFYEDQYNFYNQSINENNLNILDIGPKEGSKAVLPGKLNIRDIIQTERCYGCNNTISSNCLCSVTKLWDCEPGYFCLSPISSEKCSPGFYCPSNTFQPNFCCKGYYCPTPKEMHICPTGYFCQAGSIRPKPCYLANCPMGSSTIRRNRSILAFSTICGIVGLFVYLKNKRNQLISNKLEQIMERNNLLKSGNQSPTTFNSKIQPYKIQFNNITVKLPTGKILLNSVSGELLPGRACAIMGPSGAGKSSLLKALTGKLSLTDGEMYLNGETIDFSRLRGRVGYVPQDDIMLNDLTVYEVLYYSALLRMPASWSLDRKISRVLEVIQFLGLNSVMNSRIGDVMERGISGGQKKRVNIGMELVSNPNILFLDEPTSGLDASSASNVCSYIRNAGKQKNLTIAAVLHSPSARAFNYFDDLILMGNQGRMIYCGPRQYAEKYFSSIGFKKPTDLSLPEFYLEILSGNIENQLISPFPSSGLSEIWTRHYKLIQSNKCMDIIEEKMSEFEHISKLIKQFKIEISSCCDPPVVSNTNPLKNKNSNLSQYYIKGIKMISNIGRTMIKLSKQLMFSFVWWLDSIISELIISIEEILPYLKQSQFKKNSIGFLQTFFICFERSIKLNFLKISFVVGEQIIHFLGGLIVSVVAQNHTILGPLPGSVCIISPMLLYKACQEPVSHMIYIFAIFFGLFSMFLGKLMGMITFSKDRYVFWREASSGLAALPYFLAKSIADLPKVLLSSLSFTLGLISFFPNSSNFIDLYSIFIAVYYYGFSAGYFICHLVGPEFGNLLCVGLNIIFAVGLNGLDPSMATVNTQYNPNWRWLWQISPARWFGAAVYLVESEARNYIDPNMIGRKSLGNSEDNLLSNILNIIYIGLSWQLAAFLVMKCLNRDKQM